MGAPQTLADVLDAAADLLTPEGAWTQGADARNAAGAKTNGHDTAAVCFCAEGAIIHVAGRNPKHDAFQAMRRAVGDPWIHNWNDAPERTQAEVIAKLREAAQAARARVGTPT